MDISNITKELLSLATSVAGKIVGAVIVLVIGKIVVKALMRALKKSRLIKEAETTVAHFLINFFKIALNAVLIISVIGILGIPMTSVVTVIASAGVAIGLALQGSLSNLAGGIMILIFKPFKIDDYIDAGGFSGTVLDIGIFYTVLKTPDNKEITIPNGIIMNEPITNYSKHDTRRVDLTFSVAYGTDVERVKEILLEEGNAHELVLKDPEPFSRLSKQNQSSLDFVLRVWAKNADYWTVNFDLIEQVNERFKAEGIEIPFNQLDVNIKK